MHKNAFLGDGLDEYVVIYFVLGAWCREVVIYYYNLTNTGIENQ